MSRTCWPNFSGTASRWVTLNRSPFGLRDDILVGGGVAARPLYPLPHQPADHGTAQRTKRRADRTRRLRARDAACRRPRDRAGTAGGLHAHHAHAHHHALVHLARLLDRRAGVGIGRVIGLARRNQGSGYDGEADPHRFSPSSR